MRYCSLVIAHAFLMSVRGCCKISKEFAGRETGPSLLCRTNMKKIIIALAIATGVLAGCAVYVPDEPGGAVMRPQGGPGNGFCPPGQAKKGNC
jgi:hypothetical protein